ncbi:LLM class flavin-dependent oxidoreductase [Arthrobacter cupressi]|uniref:Flavin-dependent oxidoreductase, luciferase family (Includes alkanesulfonate monooxygenase SsuD and methylene tetrahydromethanopterin reductase) n=1 Tax=Arthrobacter cupressi TaxID=1045773 RepID=A0A1G8LD59_9MICC|nr:LLM class flavin-dependent oxidoreductase [Arthrobacter cupressi]NYD77665.1 alkanesulfonate monooxygenase SsuD/methylene tetrahydromethanopterin reductase-like flavin-dependent oxidoreductase (luciferase family) [Arthrobacter cupressi]SDI53397.1 Flavin-dependent oxidoreductase, luciferase family (includes alkanesulfonate monooxygenase SsuD and methylene tetrahydromethanopterin reductase) [Arthrobacter cupressi]
MTHSSNAGFLALELDGDGAHPAAWRKARHTPDALLNGERIRSTVLAAESAGFHAATFADGHVAEGADVAGRLNALQRAAFAGPVTGSIALVPEVDTVYTEPFHAATQLASLDYVSGGRGGWLVKASGDAREAAAVGRSVAAEDALAHEAAASVEVGRRLWDSWEDGAVIRDVPTGRYLDVDKLHYADFETPAGFPGEAYSVKGPSIIPRPLQGQLPVLAPAQLVSVDGPLLPSAVDAVLVSAPTPELLAAEAAEVRANLAAVGGGPAGRAPFEVGPAVIAELDVVLDSRGQFAAARLAELEAFTAWESPRARFVGTAAELADFLAELLAAVDGVRIHPAVLDVELEELAQLVLPELRSRGILRPAASGGTFRELLGLERPENRYATALLNTTIGEPA